MPRPLVQMSAEWGRQQPADFRSALWGGGGPRKSPHNGSFRKSINRRGGGVHNRPWASLITWRVSSLASKVRGRPGFGMGHNPLACECVSWLMLSFHGPLGVFTDLEAATQSLTIFKNINGEKEWSEENYPLCMNQNLCFASQLSWFYLFFQIWLNTNVSRLLASGDDVFWCST